MESDDEEESEAHKLKRKARDHLLDENTRIAREAEQKERAEREAQVTLESRKTLFPPWTMERILNEAIDNPCMHWLKPITSFNLENTQDSQFDMPITSKAFLFCCFNSTVNALASDTNVDRSLIEFYLS